jgi:hypothetical protein
VTVDWTRWMQMTPAEQEALVRRYRDIVRSEAMSANWKRMDEAIRRVRT